MNNDVQELLVQFLLQDNTRDRKRKIIFWYDEKQEYSEDIDDIVLSDTEIIKYDNNSFWIRYHIEKEIPDKNVLIYLPFAKKKGLDNDLLDLELNEKTQIGMVKNGIDFLGYRHILSSSGKIIVKLRYASKRRLKKHLKTVNKLYNKGIVDDEYVYQRKNSFYNHIKDRNESTKLKVDTFPFK